MPVAPVWPDPLLEREELLTPPEAAHSQTHLQILEVKTDQAGKTQNKQTAWLSSEQYG
jgi:hypothetical protein